MGMNFANPHFAEPQWLWLAILGPLALMGLQYYAGQQRRRQLLQMASGPHLSALIASHSPWRRRAKRLLALLILAGLGVTLARPQWGERIETTQAFGEDVIFLLDSSRSMLSTDIRPNRLQRAKLAILDFVQRHASGRVGYLAFAGEAFLQCPLTFDYEAFRESLLAVDDKTIPVPGTDLGRALDEGYLAMEKNQRRKIMILVTDGEDLRKSGIAMAKKLAEQGVVVYAIGVGTPFGSSIPFVNSRGTPDEVRDARGNVVQSRLDEATLQGIAGATGGRYRSLGATGEGMTEIRNYVESLPDMVGATPKRKLGIDHFHFPLALTTLLLVLESLIGTRRKSREKTSPSLGARGRFLTPSALPCFLLVLTAWPSGFGAAGTNTNSTLASNEVSLATPVAVPPRPLVTARDFHNEGTRLLGAGKFREAETALQTAVASNEEAVQSPALYNLGHARFAQGMQALQDGPEAKQLETAGNQALTAGDDALGAMGSITGAENNAAILAAYQRARGASKQLKASIKAVQQALDEYGAILLRWERASGDFRGAFELRPADTDAAFNASVVDRHIADLVDQKKSMQMMSRNLVKKRQEVQKALSQLKQRTPKGQTPGEEEDEEDEPQEPKQEKEPKTGKPEAEQKEGQGMSMTWEEAARLLQSLKLDSNRKLPIGTKQTERPKNRTGPDW